MVRSVTTYLWKFSFDFYGLSSKHLMRRRGNPKTCTDSLYLCTAVNWFIRFRGHSFVREFTQSQGLADNTSQHEQVNITQNNRYEVCRASKSAK